MQCNANQNHSAFFFSRHGKRRKTQKCVSVCVSMIQCFFYPWIVFNQNKEKIIIFRASAAAATVATNLDTTSHTSEFTSLLWIISMYLFRYTHFRTEYKMHFDILYASMLHAVAWRRVHGGSSACFLYMRCNLRIHNE